MIKHLSTRMHFLASSRMPTVVVFSKLGSTACNISPLGVGVQQKRILINTEFANYVPGAIVVFCRTQ